MDEARPGGDEGEVGNPEDVGAMRLEVPVHAVERAWRTDTEPLASRTMRHVAFDGGNRPQAKVE